MQTTAWVDGEFIKNTDALMKINEYSLHYAHSVYEGMRIYNGKVYQQKHHTNRLYSSANIIDIIIPWKIKIIMAAMDELVSRNKMECGYMRPIVWKSGKAKIGNLATNTSLAIFVWDLERRAHCNDGISLTLYKQYTRFHPDTMPVYAKASCIYGVAHLGAIHAQRNQYDDALFLDHYGYIADTSVANIFFVQSGTIYTPTPDNILNGITKQTITKLAKKHNIEIIERRIHPDELASFDEVFITGTAFEVTPITHIDNLAYPVGDITKSVFLMLKEHIYKNTQ